MKHVSIDDVDNQPSPLDVHSVRRPVSAALGTTDVAFNYFELAPGESFSGGFHTHHDQEEVFFVEEGTATFDVLATQEGGEPVADPGEEPRESVTVEAGELVRFEPGEFQEGYNDGDERVVGWALGAPNPRHDWEAIETLVFCRSCETETSHGLELTDDGGFRMICADCGSEFTT